MHAYKVYNGAMATTGAITRVTTGTTAKTMLQLATPATRNITLISWGWSIDQAAGANGAVELVETDVAATVTAHVAAGVQPLNPGTGVPASLLTLGTSATGYTASAEGTVTTTRTFDQTTMPASLTASGSPYTYQWMPDERPTVAPSKFLRVRVTAVSAVNMLCWVVYYE